MTVNDIGLVRRPTAPHLYAQVQGLGLWELDRTAVLPYSASINGGALFTHSPNVRLSLSAPAGTTQMQISNDGGFAGAAWEPYVTDKAWAITSAGETPMPRTVYVSYLTNGQLSGLYLDDIVLDREAPHGSIHMDDPLAAATSTRAVALPDRSSAAASAVLLPFVTQRHIAGQWAVTLTLSAADALSGVDTMQIGTRSDMADAQVMAFAPSLEWYTPAHGSTTIYVSYTDRAGNASVPYSATTTRP